MKSRANLVADWRVLGLSPWTGEFTDPARESDARDYLGLTTGWQYPTIQLLAAALVAVMWWLDVAELGFSRVTALTFALRWSLLVVWAVDRARIRARPRVGIDGHGMFVGQALAGAMILAVTWFRHTDVAARQFEGYIVALTILMLFANSARQRFALSALLLVCIDGVIVLRTDPSANVVRTMIMDSLSGWAIGAICSVILNSFRRRGYLHWLAERDAREQLDAEVARREIFHGELNPSQLFHMRPANGWADYRTPVPGLYHASSATHGGGGVTGIPAVQAVRAIEADTRCGMFDRVRRRVAGGR